MNLRIALQTLPLATVLTLPVAAYAQAEMPAGL